MNIRFYIKTVIVGVLLLVSSGCILTAPTPNTYPDFTAIADRENDTVVKIFSNTRNSNGRRQVSSGSGFVLSSDGYILTNYHIIIDSTSNTQVQLSNYRTYTAKMVGHDVLSDIAILKIDVDETNLLQAVTFGDSDNITRGDWVMAIGQPFGMGYSVSVGVISSAFRVAGGNAYVPFIQTDAAINTGNSGGPLFNVDGEVIGMNSQIITNNGGFLGISLAIPSNIIQRVSEELITTGIVEYGKLGVILGVVTSDLAEINKLDFPIGVLVVDVEPDGPAQVGGVQSGDIVVGLGGVAIPNIKTLTVTIRQSKVGAVVDVDIIRDGEPLTLMVEVDSLAPSS